MTRRLHTQFLIQICICLFTLLSLSACGGSHMRGEGNGMEPLGSAKVMEQAASSDRFQIDGMPNSTVSGRDRYASYLIERGESALSAGQYEEASRLFKQVGRIPGYESRGQDGMNRVPARPSITACPAPDPKAPVQVCQSFSGTNIPTNPGDVALGRTILQEEIKPAVVASAAAEVASPATLAQGDRANEQATTAVVSAVKSETLPVKLEAQLQAVKDDPLKRRVTLEFRDASVRSLFDVISKASGLSVIFDRDISPDLKTTVYLRNTTIKAAMDKIVLTSGLAWRELDEGTLLVYNDDANKQHDYQALTIRSFQLANADAKFVGNSLKSVLKFRDVVVDEKLNMIIVRDTPESIAMAEKLIMLHDMPEPEVMLEVAVMEVSRGKLQSLGVAWPTSMSLTPLARTVSSTSSTVNTTSGISSDSTNYTLTLRDLFNLTPGTLAMGLGSATVNFSATDSDINVLANPRIRAKNREKAKIMIGERVPQLGSNTTSTGIVSQNVTYIDVGLKLDVEPQVFPGNEIGLKIALEVSSINGTIENKGTVAYRIGTRNASTVLRLKDGENQVLAGLIQDNERKAVSKVPLLGDIPLLGRLFRSDNDEKTKTEIVLSITPRLIRGNQMRAAGDAGFDAGTYSSVRGRRGDGDSGGSVDPVVSQPQSASPAQTTNDYTQPAAQRQQNDSSMRQFGGSRD